MTDLLQRQAIDAAPSRSDTLVREGAGKMRRKGPDVVADYVGGKMALARYLRDGLDVLHSPAGSDP